MPSNMDTSSLIKESDVHYGGVVTHQNNDVQSGSSSSAAVTPDMCIEKVKKEKWRIVLNVVIFSATMLLAFTGFHGVAILQTAVNHELGATCLSIVFGSLFVSAGFVSPWFVPLVTPKYTLLTGYLCLVIYILAQFWPSYATMVPASVLLGMGLGPFWTAVGTYVNKMSQRYAVITKQDVEFVTPRFFGYVFFHLQLSYCSGSLIASGVMATATTKINIEGDSLMADAPVVEAPQCGLYFCPGDVHNDSYYPGNETSSSVIYGLEGSADINTQEADVLMGELVLIFSSLALLSAIIVGCALEPLWSFESLQESSADGGQNTRPCRSLQRTTELVCQSMHNLRQFILHPRAALLIPLQIFAGFEHSYMVADYTAAYVGCGLGVPMIGFVVVLFGASNAVSSLVLGPLVSLAGRRVVCCCAAVTTLVAVVLMTTWTYDMSQIALLYVIAVLWGLADGFWQPQVKALYGVLLPENPEAVFSGVVMLEALGISLNSALQAVLCNREKVLILLLLLVAGMTGYFVLENILHKEKLPVVQQLQLGRRDQENNSAETSTARDGSIQMVSSQTFGH